MGFWGLHRHPSSFSPIPWKKDAVTVHKRSMYLTRQSESDCPSVAQGSPDSLFADISPLSENCDSNSRNSARDGIVEEVKSLRFENKWTGRSLNI